MFPSAFVSTRGEIDVDLLMILAVLKGRMFLAIFW